MPTSLRTLVALVLMLIFTAAARAQTGPELAQQPWEQDTQTDVTGEVRWFDQADIDHTNHALNLMRYDARGRVRLNESNDTQGDEVRLGFDYTHLDLDSADPALPERLVDVSVAGSWMRELKQSRRIGAVAGVGYAGDAPFGDSDAIYFMGNLIFEQPLDQQSKLTLSLNYDGNRTIWPDVPLPLIAYTRKVNDEFMYTVGVPFSSVRWQPDDRWTVSATYVPVVTANARVDYALTDHWQLFGQFENSYDAFVVNSNEDRRLFFQQRRLEAGVTYQASDHCAVTFAGGYAFDQSFKQGWDVRDTETVRDVDDAPFLCAAVRLAF